MQGKNSKPWVTVVGVGNLSMGDDGVGVRIIEWLTRDPGDSQSGPTGSIEYLDGSVGGLRLLNWIEQANRLLFVDAGRFGGSPGQCRLLSLDDLLAHENAKPQATRPFSLHQTDLAGVLRLARQFYRVPPTWLLAIQIESVEPRAELSLPLSAALPRLVEIVRRLAGRLARKE